MKNLVRMAALAGCCFSLTVTANAQTDASGTKATAATSAADAGTAPSPAARPGKGRTYTGGRRGAETGAVAADVSAQPTTDPVETAEGTDARIGRITGAGGKGGMVETQDLAAASSADTGECSAQGDPAGGSTKSDSKACDVKALIPLQQDKGHSEKGIK